MFTLSSARSAATLVALAALPIPGPAQVARISEEIRTIATYPFSEPNPIPILDRDTRLYPYHSFEGYSTKSIPQQWKVVKLENDLIEVFVLPEIGGKVWGAVVKQSGNEFIYRNEVIKFRNIALRGPWTSGGIEFNFGVIGHTPSTATPVDYLIRKNDDGSVSCIIGMMDLPSRTHWRVEIRLEADRASFETNVQWFNPTQLEQPYYNWMTAAAPAQNDLRMTIPGNASLGHPGNLGPWPTDDVGRDLSQYSENAFGSNKSYHVVGERADFFGGYFSDADYGFGHWAQYGEMPGQKLWLWALSRAGGIWEDLLTDTDGQYVEYQAGRLLVQYSPNGSINPISQVGFSPGTNDRWSDTWFPLEGTGGLTAASHDGAVYSRFENGQLLITAMSFVSTTDTLHVTDASGKRVSLPLKLDPLSPVTSTVAVAPGSDYELLLPALGIQHSSAPDAQKLSKPWETGPTAARDIPRADRLAVEARQLALGRKYPTARLRFEQALALEPWHRDAMLGIAELELRRDLPQAGLVHTTRLLELDSYDPAANFVAAGLFRELGQTDDAIDAYGWAARSPTYRSVANVQLAEIAIATGRAGDARRHAHSAIDYDRFNLPAREVLALVARQDGVTTETQSLHDEMLEIDPLHHFVFAEEFLSTPTEVAGRQLLDRVTGEYPGQAILELAVDYARRGATDDAALLLTLNDSPISVAWRAWLLKDPSLLPDEASLEFVFPYRAESIQVFEWANNRRSDWSWRYLLALNLWAVDRQGEAAELMETLDGIDYAPALVARGHLLEAVRQVEPGDDLRLAVELAPNNRIVLIELVQYLQRSGNWVDAREATAIGRTRFPGDFNIDLLHVTALLQLGEADESIAVLASTDVLPSEHARNSHQLYQQAHVLAALDALDAGETSDAVTLLDNALLWPEHLGQGRPYQPEERLVMYLRGIAASRLGNSTSAAEEWQAVVAASEPNSVSPLRFLGRSARALLNQESPVLMPDQDPNNLESQLVARALETRP